MTSSLFEQDILNILEDEAQFVDRMARAYQILTIRHGADLSVAAVRLEEAHGYWQEDVRRTLSRGIADSDGLDHFKHAAFISFWLRRTNPIVELYIPDGWLESRGEVERLRRENFALFANEICSLGVGFSICLMYESNVFMKSQESSVVSINGRMSRLDYIRRVRFPQSLVREFSKIIKHKNMSPYAMYMMYKSLFATIYVTDVL